MCLREPESGASAEAAPSQATLDRRESERIQMKAKIESLMENAEEARTCKVCFDGSINCALQDCGHLCVCTSCADSLKGRPCPICQRPIKSYLKSDRERERHTQGERMRTRVIAGADRGRTRAVTVWNSLQDLLVVAARPPFCSPRPLMATPECLPPPDCSRPHDRFSTSMPASLEGPWKTFSIHRCSSQVEIFFSFRSGIRAARLHSLQLVMIQRDCAASASASCFTLVHA